MLQKRTCIVCGLTKPMDDFPKFNNGKKTYHKNTCKKCYNLKIKDKQEVKPKIKEPIKNLLQHLGNESYTSRLQAMMINRNNRRRG